MGAAVAIPTDIESAGRVASRDMRSMGASRHDQSAWATGWMA
jgi:hypothetical protein